MRIATWNVNGLKARLDFILLWLKERQPDVVGFQELKQTDDKFPHDAFEAAGLQNLVIGFEAPTADEVIRRMSAFAAVAIKG